MIKYLYSDTNENKEIIKIILSKDYKLGKRALIDLKFTPNKTSIYSPSRKVKKLYIMDNLVLIKR